MNLYQFSPEPPATAEAFQRFNRGIYTIKLLGRLTTAVQQHRGSTMGYLSGEPAFLPRITRLQSKIARILQLLADLERKPGDGITGDTLLHIQSDWKTIVLGWQEDQILHNFEFHGHLVDALNRSLKHCMQAHLAPALAASTTPIGPRLETLFVQLPHTIELLATLRGLGTNVAVIKACGTDSHQKIAFLLKEIPRQHKRLLAAQDAIPELHALKSQRQALYKFLLTIQVSILDNPEISVDSTFLFRLSSDVIDAHWHALEQGIQDVETLGYDLLLDN